MEVPESILQRMPQDLMTIIAKSRTADVPIHIRDPPEVEIEVISAGSFDMKAYFPPLRREKTLVCIHFPGGICKNDINRDQSCCLNMAKECGYICVNVNYPSALEVNYRQIFTHCQYAHTLVRNLCQGNWKDTWNTDPSRIILSGSSIGSTLALNVAGIAALNGEPVLGIIAIAPVVQTASNHETLWGENESTPGLTPKRLLNNLAIAFKGVDAEFRDNWHCDPWKMPNVVIRKLPRVIIVSLTLDVLYKSQAEFAYRLQSQGVDVKWKTVDGLHQVNKDMYQTRASQEIAGHVKRMAIEIATRAQIPLLNHQEAMLGL